MMTCRTIKLSYICGAGRCNIQVNVDIPVDTELAGPLQEGCIWRQARGSAAEVSGFDDMDASSQEVGVAQQWFDELDNLAFETVGDDANGNPETNSQEENRLSIHSAINISPGTSEVIIYAALYLKMKKNSIYQEFCHEENVKRILDIVNHRSGKLGTDACAQLSYGVYAITGKEVTTMGKALLVFSELQILP
ncbi:hypothetical protein IFM89_038849 [Coptis chinensis]|uniref:Uncharacterized protein n=1 Tax=Coptis chinensis TaxID=261450 RepID=A0A835M352_9MAGN|nr:hypothetical protein IFM89_038849 [Coptis chinensis]